MNENRPIDMQARQGEYGALAREVFHLVKDIVETRVKVELAAIDASLPSLIETHEWRGDGSTVA